jgi:SAM-dependent methyltransferase
MGIAKGAVALLYELKQTTPLSGTVCQLGRQHVYLSGDELGVVASRFGFSATVTGKVDDVAVFKSLGFGVVESVDYSDFEQPTHTLDLNQPVAESFREKYDAIFDGGTLEHVFNFPVALKNIHTMLKPGGLIIHASPSHNHVDHGFYMFSPTVFYDYYRANRYDIEKMYIFEYEADHAGRPWLIYNYTPAAVAHLSFGGWGRKLLGIWCVARKTAASSCDVVPQQSFYVSAWAEKEVGKTSILNGANLSGGVLRRLKSKIVGNKFLEPRARALWNSFRRVFPKLGNRRPRVIARY